MDYRKMAESLTGTRIQNLGRCSELENQVLVRGEKAVLLWLLSREGKAYAVDIVRESGLSFARVANILKGMEYKELIERTPEEDNRRKAAIVLTEKGKDEARKERERLVGNQERILESLGEEKAGELLSITEDVLSSLA